MYTDKRSLVSIPTPSNGAKIYILKNGYVYYATESYWDKEKKRMIDNRVIIGKVNDDNKNLMYPNSRFAELFGSVDDEVKTLRSFYNSEQRREAGDVDIFMSYAPYVILKKCGEKCGLIDALNRSMPSISDSILAIAMHAVIAMESSAQSFTLWSFDNYCGNVFPKSDSEISRIYKKIGKNNEDQFVFFELYKKIFHQTFPQSKERVIAFDSTNQVSESKNQSMAQYGKSKTKEKHPIINTALFVDEQTCISIYYEHFEGNILDKSQTPYTLEKCKNLGYEKLFYMMDRGYYSFKNLKKINNLDFGFGVMVPETVGIVEELIKLNYDKIKLQENYYIRECNIYGVQTTVNLKSKNGESQDYFAYVYYDDKTAFEERNSIHSKVNYYFEKAQQRKRYSDKMKKEFAKFAIIVTKCEVDKKTKKNFILSIDTEMVQKSYEYSGFFIILSNRKITATNMILIARGRDSSEKAFMYIKSHFNLSRTYMHSGHSYKGKMFIAFISLVLLQSFRWYMKSMFEKRSSETTATLIGELYKYKIFQNKEGKWIPVYSMNEKQKEIIQCVGISETEIEDNIRSMIFNKYAKKKQKKY